MGRVDVYDQIKKAFQDLVAPELHALRGDIRVLDQRLNGLDQKIDSVSAAFTQKSDSLRTETISMKGELLAEIRRLDTRIAAVDRELRIAIDIRERLAALEARRAS